MIPWMNSYHQICLQTLGFNVLGPWRLHRAQECVRTDQAANDGNQSSVPSRSTWLHWLDESQQVFDLKSFSLGDDHFPWSSTMDSISKRGFWAARTLLKLDESAARPWPLNLTTITLNILCPMLGRRSDHCATRKE